MRSSGCGVEGLRIRDEVQDWCLKSRNCRPYFSPASCPRAPPREKPSPVAPAKPAAFCCSFCALGARDCFFCERTNRNVLTPSTRKPGPDFNPGCLVCTLFARLKAFSGLSPERQDQVLVLTVLFVQYSLKLKRVKDFHLKTMIRLWC